jgi:cytochrome b561
MWKNHVISYSFRSRVIHWIVALCVIALLIGGFNPDLIPIAFKPTMHTIHESIGLTVLFLMGYRLYALMRDGRPALPIETSKWEVWIGRFVQYSLYIFLIIQPLSGWMTTSASSHPPKYFRLITLNFFTLTNVLKIALVTQNIHEYSAVIICGLIALHILGALKHFIWNKDRLLQTMLFNPSAIQK